MNCSPKKSDAPFKVSCWPRALRVLALALSTIGLAASNQAQELIYKEDFNTDGDGTRYFTEGRGVVQAIPKPAGPSYWTRNTDVVAFGEVVGVPFPAPARRVVMAFNHRLDPQFLTADGKKLLTSTINWLLADKKNAVIMFSQAHGTGELDLGDAYLVDTLTAAGHTVIDDDTGTALADVIKNQKVDLIINSSTGGDPLRITVASVPMLSFAADLIGDLLLATRGDVDLTFDPGDIKIENASHPIATGLPAKFKFVSESQPFDTPGLGLPAGSVTVASYQYSDPNTGTVSTKPFLVATEKGVQLLGGLISGMEGSGFWAGADLNEPTIANGEFNTATTPRSLTLKPVDVTGKTKVKLTLTLAGTEVDFDGPGGDDFLFIKADINNTGEFVELAKYGAPTGTEKFLIEMFKDGVETKDYTKRVGIVGKDFTYDIPAGATKLVIRFEAFCTFWNEIMAFDNIRITSGDIVATPPKITFSRAGNEVTLTWEGTAFNLETSAKLGTGASWSVVSGATSGYKASAASGNAYFRLKSK